LVPRLHRLLVIAESTDALLGNLFELEDLGAKDVKGTGVKAKIGKSLSRSEMK